MKTLLKFFSGLSLATFLLLPASCNKEDAPQPNPGADTFEGVVAQGRDFDSFPESRTVDTLASGELFEEDVEAEDNGNTITQRWICTTRTLSVLDGSGQFPLFNTNADVIYPGNLLQGKTLNNATPSPIVVKRAGGTISYSLNNGNLESAFRVDSVAKGSIQTAMNSIINGAGSVVPANFNLEIVEVHSKSQLALEMGLNVSTFNIKVGANLDFSTDRAYNRFLVKLNQEYYTMSFDLPTSLAEIFHPSVRPEQLAVYIQPDNPAAFISSVTYGRIFYLLVESTSSSQEMRAKLNASYSGFSNSVSGNVNVESFNSLSNVRLRAIAYGGDASGSFTLVGERSIQDIAEKLEESTNIKAGLPLSYQVRSVERPDQVVGTRIATEYDVTTCELKGVLPPLGYRPLVDLFDDGFGAMIHIANSNVVFYNKAGTQYAWYNGNSGQVLGTFAIDDPNGPLGASAFSSIGAGVRYTDNSIYLFERDGLKCEIFRYDEGPVTGNSLPMGPIGSFDQSEGSNRVYLINEIFGDSGNFQFANRSFSAATRIGATKMQYYANPGDEYAVYDRSGNGSWGNPVPGNTPLLGNTPSPFAKIGAASFISFGGSSGRWLYINEAGDQLLEWYSVPAPKIEGPWVVN
ncbi:MAG: thiol-activated cytolysin family protein [Lewinellaceae bacterium]|nr:thiol-activated cytolysin family protein [Phaeodactylibacter sp.]MCB9039091.1 thiol-activated cytolysin family protein [Lewinellaceae bacterium]